MFKRIYFFFLSYMSAMFFAQTLLILWLSKKGFGFIDLVIFYLISYIIAIFSIFFFPKIKISAKRSIFFGTLFSALMVLVLVKIFSAYQLYLSSIFNGLNTIFFWIPYNIMYFKFSKEDSRGFNSGMYFLIMPIVAITLQPLAGIVAEKFGFETMFLIGMCAYTIPLVLLKFLPSFEFEINIKKYFLERHFNWSTLFQGVISRVENVLVPIFTLFFIKSPRQFGSFFGYLAIMTAIASVINGHLSDKLKNRKVFFYLFSSLAVISILPLAFVNNIYYWGIFAGISSLCASLASPFWLTFNLDYYKNIGVENTMVLREFFLNIGYVVILLVSLLVFYFTSSPKVSLIVVSIVCLFLPVVSYLQGVYRDII